MKVYSIIAENAVMPHTVPQSASSTLPLPSVPSSPGGEQGGKRGELSGRGCVLLLAGTLGRSGHLFCLFRFPLHLLLFLPPELFSLFFHLLLSLPSLL